MNSIPRRGYQSCNLLIKTMVLPDITIPIRKIVIRHKLEILLFTIYHLSMNLVKFSFSEKATKIWSLLSKRQIKWVITPNLCGLLRKTELYLHCTLILIQRRQIVVHSLEVLSGCLLQYASDLFVLQSSTLKLHCKYNQCKIYSFLLCPIFHCTPTVVLQLITALNAVK